MKRIGWLLRRESTEMLSEILPLSKRIFSKINCANNVYTLINMKVLSSRKPSMVGKMFRQTEFISV